MSKFDTSGWKEFKIGDLFEKLELKFLKTNFEKAKDISKIKTAEFNLPLVNVKDGNNGIMYYGRSCDFESAEMTLDIVNDGAVSTGNVYAQPQKTGVLYNAYLVKPKFSNATIEILLWFAILIQKSIKHKFSYENKASWNKIKDEFIQLPVKQNGEIDFEYMETTIKNTKFQMQNILNAYKSLIQRERVKFGIWILFQILIFHKKSEIFYRVALCK